MLVAMYIRTSQEQSTRAIMCMRGDKRSPRQTKTSFILFYQLSRIPASDLGAVEDVIMDPVEAEQNCRRSLRNKRESAKQENGVQARRLKLETTVLG